MWILLFLIVWTVASTVMLIRNLGNKNKPGPKKHSPVWWWEQVFYAPTLVLATIIGFVLRLVGK